MPLIILHDLDGGDVIINTDTITAARRREPDSRSHIKAPFTKLYYSTKIQVGMPDTVQESPAEIYTLAQAANGHR